MFFSVFVAYTLLSLNPIQDLVLLESSEESFEIVNMEMAIHNVEQIYVVNSRDALKDVDLEQFYNKFVNIRQFDVQIETLEGKRLKRFKERDFSDYSASSSFSLYEDNRVKALEISWNEFPVRIRIRKKIEYSSSLIWPNWYPKKHIPSLQSSFTLIGRSDEDFQFYEHKLDSMDHVVVRDKKVIHTWRSGFQSAFKIEPWSSRSYSSLPRLLLTPRNFEVDGYRGKMDTWENFGKWFYDLNKNKQTLPEPVKKEIAAFIKDSMSEKEKISSLYNYLQRNTRYVSVQLGIGGFQTFDADYVAKNKYGDCKALSNFMISMLQSQNIKAYPVLIKGEKYFDDIVTEFPSNQFNHVIVAVPTEQDTVWLECTSSLNPMGYLGAFTAARHGLLISENGGELVMTTSLGFKENERRDTLHIYVSNKNTARLKAKMYRSGFSSERFASLAYSADNRELKKFVRNQFNFTSLDISDVNIERMPNTPEAILSFEAEIPKVGKPVGPHMLITPFGFGGGFRIPDTTKGRTAPIVMDYAETINTVVFYHFEKPISNISNGFSESDSTIFSSNLFEANFVDDKTLKAEFNIEFKSKKIDPELFGTFAGFLKSVNKNFEYTTLIKF